MLSSSELDLDVDARGQVETHQRVNGLGGRVDDVDQTLVERCKSAESRISLLPGTPPRYCDVDETRDWFRLSKHENEFRYGHSDNSLGAFLGHPSSRFASRARHHSGDYAGGDED
jgi:hypothetical protein